MAYGQFIHANRTKAPFASLAQDLGLEVHPQHYAGKRILDLHCLPGPLQHLGLNEVPHRCWLLQSVPRCRCPVVTVVKKKLLKA